MSIEMKKETAIEWLIGELNGYDEDCEIFRIAKAMENEQIIDAWDCGYNDYVIMVHTDAEEYYNKTYGGDK
jgi:hypothetical protein